MPATTPSALVNDDVDVDRPAAGTRLTWRTWSWYPAPETVSVYSPGVGRSGRVNRPTGPDVTVVAVRVVDDVT